MQPIQHARGKKKKRRGRKRKEEPARLDHVDGLPQQLLAHDAHHARLLQDLARHVQRQVVRVDHALEEEGHRESHSSVISVSLVRPVRHYCSEARVIKHQAFTPPP